MRTVREVLYLAFLYKRVASPINALGSECRSDEDARFERGLSEVVVECPSAENDRVVVSAARAVKDDAVFVLVAAVSRFDLSRLIGHQFGRNSLMMLPSGIVSRKLYFS